MNITTHILKPGGSFVAKIFRGKDVSLLYSQLKIFFKDVVVSKPRSSRNSSIEAFAVCRNFTLPDGYEPTMFSTLMEGECRKYFDEVDNAAYLTNRMIIPFMACGDLSQYDSDSTYSLSLGKNYQYHEPNSSPIDPPYLKALELKRAGTASNSCQQ